MVVMPIRIINDERSAKTVWHLYREYGLGKFANWLSMKTDSIEREEVLRALRFPETRKAAKKRVEYYKTKLEELESMLSESESDSSQVSSLDR